MVHLDYLVVLDFGHTSPIRKKEEHVRTKVLTDHLHTIASIARLAVILSQPTCCLNSGPMC